MHYHLQHQTTYTYSDSVTISHHAARLRPRDLPRQTCESFELTFRPQPAVQKERTDFFGNHVRFFSIQEVHQGLDIVARSRVTVEPAPVLRLEDSPAWEHVTALFLEPVRPRNVSPYQFVFDSHLLHITPELADYARPSFPAGRPMLDGARALCRRIHQDFTFDPEATTVATPLGEVLRARHGVCQDFAHVAIASLRALGLAARYVSGYIRTRPPEGQARLVGADASHAWLAVYCPVFGWVDLDPTNDLMPSEEHITVAFGRDYADVSPVAGVLTGGGEHQVRVSVDVEVAGASPTGGGDGIME
jgi:transglutaminase-like putative cysteine protease